MFELFHILSNRQIKVIMTRYHVLPQVNGANIEDLSREAIVDLIKKSPDTMTLKVQPIPELIELSIRPNKDGSSVDIQEDAAKSGTLKRTGSLRYRKGVSTYLNMYVCVF